MKNRIFTLAIIAVLMIFGTNQSYAVRGVNPAPAQTETTQELTKQERKAAKKQVAKEKRQSKILDKMQKKYGDDAGVDFKDDVEKWMWFWIFGWVLGGILSVISVIIALGSLGTASVLATALSWVGGLVGAFGTASLVIWLIKKYN